MDWMSSIVEPLVGGVAKGLTQSFAPGASGGGGGGAASVPRPDFDGLMAPMGNTKVDTTSSAAAPVTDGDAVSQRWAALLSNYGQK